jgi:RecB family endonuclease NucS
MPIFEMNADRFKEIQQSSFTELGIKERGDIQRLLKKDISVLSDELYVLAEEFGEWEESNRRIDLLAIDQDANLVVIELKRTHDGGHMDLQAIRYASMVAGMTFDRAIRIHASSLGKSER